MHSSKGRAARHTKREGLGTSDAHSKSNKAASFYDSAKTDRAKQGSASGEKVTKEIGKSSSSGQFKGRVEAGRSRFSNETSDKRLKNKPSHHLPYSTVKEETKYPSYSYAKPNTNYEDLKKNEYTISTRSQFKNMEEQMKESAEEMYDDAKKGFYDETCSPMRDVSDKLTSYEDPKAATFKVRSVPRVWPYGDAVTKSSAIDYELRDRTFGDKEDHKSDRELRRKYSSYYGKEGERESCKLPFNLPSHNEVNHSHIQGQGGTGEFGQHLLHE
eukprot:TRINITY_DN6428_c0_g2_i4.p2 TRINITY_DN6428_c0_g2~~TRINITY_DN6428_c0_g2_i4.p2  ORF type:complete len:272 (+),score=39.88 TRINITY_DN6428_c0_g2_i4:192-1007(+)